MIRFLLILLGSLMVVPVYAVSRLQDFGVDCPPFMECSDGVSVVIYLSGRLVMIANQFLRWLAIVGFLYGALRLIVSRGEEGKEAGKKAMIYASIGFALALLAGAIIDFVCDYLYSLGEGTFINHCQ